MKTLNLKTRFAIVMSISALALVIGMGAISVHFAQDDLLHTLSAEQLAMVARVVGKVDDDLKLASDTLIASASAMPREVAMDPTRFNAFFAQSPALTQLFEQVFVIDARGTVVSAFPQKEFKLVGLNLGDRRYYQRVMISGKSVISDPLRGRVTGAPLLNIAAPITDADGNVVGVMVGVMTLAKKNVLGDYSKARLGKTGYFMVVTSWPDPVYLAHPDVTRLMQPASGDTSPAMTRILNDSGPGSIVTTLEDGREALVTFQPMKMSNWVMAAVLPGEEAFAAVVHARTRTIEIGVLAGVIVLPLVWGFAWLLFRPLNRLRDQVASIASDMNGSALATVGRHDEVGEVAVAFNAMLAEQRASEALRLASDQDRRRLVAILESSQDLVFMTDVDGRFTYLNAAARARRGIGLNDDAAKVTREDFLPQWAFDKLQKEAIPGALRDGIWVGEMAVRDKDGHEVTVDQTVIAHRNVNGGLEFFSSLMHDTSTAQAASIAVRSSEARMLSIADALPVHVSFIDRELRYRFVNSIYEKHFGLEKSAFIGRTVAEIIGDKAFAVYQPFFTAAAAGNAQIFEIESHAGVRPAHLLVKLIPQFDDVGEITGFHFIHQDVTDHKVENQRLSQLARADALTGLVNRAGFETAIVEAMGRSRHHLAAMALFYLDVDRFKGINDKYGHQIGDKLLRGFAARLVRAVRSADVAARLGGDEFVVIAEGVRNVDDVRSIAAKILRTMRPAFDFGGVSLSITASIGVAVYAGEEIKVEDLIQRADTALYRAKDGGRNCYALDDELQTFGTTSLIADNVPAMR